jgi:hypothetical protein
MIGGIEETSASFEARSAPRSYPTIPRGASLERKMVDGDTEMPDGVVWLDLLSPNPPESKLVE